MKQGNWLAVIGSREANHEMRQDITRIVDRAIDEGMMIVSGGSTGVDTVATMAALEAGGAERLRIYLPTEIGIFVAGLQARVLQGKCLVEDADVTIAHLLNLQEQNPDAIVGSPNHDRLSPEAFYERNEQILALANRVVAFHLHGNVTASHLIAGTARTVGRARELGIRVAEHDYFTS